MIDWDTPLPNGGGRAAYVMRPSLGAAFDAGRLNYDAGSTSIARDVYAGQIGAEITKALAARGRTFMVAANGKRITYKPESLRRDYIAQPTVQPRLLQDIAAERRRDPNFLKDLFPEGVSEAALEAAIIARRRRDFESSSAVLEDAEGVAANVAGFVGGLAATFEDPLQLVGMGATAALPITAIAGRATAGATALAPRLFGGSMARARATRIAARLGTAGTINMGVVAATLPVIDDRLQEIGVEMDAGDVATQLGFGFVAGVGIEGFQMGLGAASSAAMATPAAKTAKEAVTGSVRRMAAALRRTADERPLTGDEADALAVLDDAARDIGSSPYVPTPEGDAAHAARLEETVSALENDRPIDPAPFEEPAPPVKAEVNAALYMEAARIFVGNRDAGPVTPEAFARIAGIGVDDARQVLMTMAATDKSLRMVVRTDKATGAQVQSFRRAPQRQGPVDLLTWIADRGGVSTKNTHSQLTTLGQKFIPGAGPLLRSKGMDLDTLGGLLWEEGWFPGRGPNIDDANGLTTRPTEAEVLELLDRAMRGEKIYNVEDGAAVAERTALAADVDLAAHRAEFRPEMERWWLESLPEFVTEGRGPTPEEMAGLEFFMQPGRDAQAVFDAWMESRAAERSAEAEAGYDLDGGEWPPDYDSIGGYDGADSTNPAIAGAAGRSAENGGGPGAVAGDAAEGGAGRAIDPRPIGDVDGAASAGEAALSQFDDPAGGPGVTGQLESLVHDLRAEVEAAADVVPDAPPANPLDLGEQVDPAAAERARQELALRASSPMRGPAGQADLADTGLFGQIDAFAMHDGKTQTKADLLAEIEADEAALNTLRGCL